MPRSALIRAQRQDVCSGQIKDRPYPAKDRTATRAGTARRSRLTGSSRPSSGGMTDTLGSKSDASRSQTCRSALYGLRKSMMVIKVGLYVSASSIGLRYGRAMAARQDRSCGLEVLATDNRRPGERGLKIERD